MPDLTSQIEDLAIRRALSDLLEEGIDDEFLKPLIDKFQNYIITKGSIDNLIEEIKSYTIGSSSKKGALERYVKQVNSDSLTQFTANYNQILTEDAGYEFYQYVGNVQRDTRDFCKERVNNYYHYKEIEDWANEDWPGKIDGTNESSIFTYRGGWNCEHQLIAVPTKLVPKRVIVRNIEKGFYEPSQEIINYFDLES